MTSQDIKHVKLPDESGVYFFNSGAKILYIGKATSIRDRVRSYFNTDLTLTRSPAISEMIKRAKSISFIKTNSVLEALILEANLIKKYKPIFNTQQKDDKSFNFVIFTNEKYPAVVKIRGKDLKEGRIFGGAPFDKLRTRPLKIFGPFPHGAELEEALKIVRKIIPFRDLKCRPEKNEPCFNYQIGLCPGVCLGKISSGEYALLLKKITLIFEGKINSLVGQLKTEMQIKAKKKDFESAGKIRDQIFALEHIKDVALIKDQGEAFLNSENKIRFKRVEVYDIAHLGGESARGAMVVFEDGEPKKTDYRVFKISEMASRDDLLSLREILSRRLAHSDWPLPNLIIVDGGQTQLKVAEMAILSFGLKIPVISVVKDDKHNPKAIFGDVDFTPEEKQEIFKFDTEAHRFAILHHRLAMRKRLV